MLTSMSTDEEEDMPNTKTARITDLLPLIRRGAAATHGVRGGRVVAGSVTALRRLDDWTLVAFNPRYPTRSVSRRSTPLRSKAETCG
jgi:hypothetical protein